MRTKIQIYMGWDSREDLPFQVARESIRKRCSTPLAIMPLRLEHLDGILTRPIEHRDGKLWCPISDAPMSTEFAISRFVVPFLQDKGWALFCDCDILCWTDINELFGLADDRYAVMVCKHRNGEPGTFFTQGLSLKMDGQVQTYYSRKNWSSVVLWNCEHPANKRLTSERLNNWPGRDLHAFKWLEDSEIGSLPQQWNWLVNVEPYVTDQILLQKNGTAVTVEAATEPIKQGIWHYTLGGPWFDGWPSAPHDEEWIKESVQILCLA